MTIQKGNELELETTEWIESIAYVLEHQGETRAKELLNECQDFLLKRDVKVDAAPLNTPYKNTIPPSEQEPYPGDVNIEKRIENIIRWNAMAMVLQAYDSGTGVGGHIATYASAATFMETGFHHIFKSKQENYGGDIVNVQAHASPGIYARAYLEGRLNETQLRNFRRQLQDTSGLPSYPHPRQLDTFWQAPTASMGLSTPSAIYQARFIKYLEARGLKPQNGGKVWNVIGDGESDEPEVLGTINIASREKLDNLVLVINCNLQRLDGPVRGNGKIIQELERSFRGADWEVIKVIWGSGWDPLLDKDSTGELQRRMDEALDGDYQMYSVSGGDVQREHWVENSPELSSLMNSLSDDELRNIQRGGQDPKKIFAAFDRAAKQTQRPTVILIKTIKGDGMGSSMQGRNTAHQKKNMSAKERIECGRRLGIPLSDEQLGSAQFYKPGYDSEELRYLRKHREGLGGYLPQRVVNCEKLPPLNNDIFDSFFKGSGERELSTTTAMVSMIAKLLKDKDIGKYIVPIVPDEARTFGMESLFKQAGIYSPEGQKYAAVDNKSLLPYRESKQGQILQEGICEVGAMASFMAAGTAYAYHGVPSIPFYVFYSIFGFQRVGDMIWSCADSLCRGFLLGGTAGRTTLNGEGLQHQDGHSHVLASTVPSLKSYDPCFAYELAIIVKEGIRQMYEESEKIFFYLTVYNETYKMPPKPENLSNATLNVQVMKGMYCLERCDEDSEINVHILSSGAIMQQALKAKLLLEKYGIGATIWSVTSYTELARNAQACERLNRLNPTKQKQVPYLTSLLNNESGVFVAVSDYMKCLPEGISRWIPGKFITLGTDGFGICDSREMLRKQFEVSAEHIAFAAISGLYDDGHIDETLVTSAHSDLTINSE